MWKLTVPESTWTKSKVSNNDNNVSSKIKQHRCKNINKIQQLNVQQNSETTCVIDLSVNEC